MNRGRYVIRALVTTVRLQRRTNQPGDTITHLDDLASLMLSREHRPLANSPSGATASADTFTYDADSWMLTGVQGLYANTLALTDDAGSRKSPNASAE